MQTDPHGYRQLSSIAAATGQDLGLLAGEAGFELYDLGFVDDARAAATALGTPIDTCAATTIICDAGPRPHGWCVPRPGQRGGSSWPPGSFMSASGWTSWTCLAAIQALRGPVSMTAMLVRGLGVLEAPRRVLARTGSS